MAGMVDGKYTHFLKGEIYATSSAEHAQRLIGKGIATAAPEPEQEIALSKLTVAQLRDLADEAGIAHGGLLKAQLIAAIEASEEDAE